MQYFADNAVCIVPLAFAVGIGARILWVKKYRKTGGTGGRGKSGPGSAKK